MTNREKAYIKKWLEVAEHDLEAAQTILQYKPIILDIVCFHCQQAVEKYLKAFMAFKNIHFEKTHDVILLKTLCAKEDQDFKIF